MIFRQGRCTELQVYRKTKKYVYIKMKNFFSKSTTKIVMGDFAMSETNQVSKM